MYELVQAGANTYYVEAPAKMGLYRLNETDVCLIDSGNDKEAGRKLARLIEQNGWRLRCVVNTHSNADHIGGNRALQARTGCKIFAGGIEGAFTRAPILEPSFLYGGYPCAALRHKFLLAQGSDALEFSHPDFPRELEVIELPGHFFEMAGFRTPDGVVFLADCVSSEATLEKYQVSFLYDVAKHLETLDMVERMAAPLFVPAHAPTTADIAPLVRANRDKVFEVADTILSLCAEPVTAEELLKRVFDRYGLAMDFAQYALVGSTVRSYLSWLSDAGRIDARFEENRLLWQKTAC